MVTPAGSILGIFIVTLAAIISLAFFFSGLYKRYRLIRLGRESRRFHQPFRRIAGLVPWVLGQGTMLKGISRNDRSGLTHAFVFWAGVLFSTGYVFFVVGQGFKDNFARTVLGRPLSTTISFPLDILCVLGLIALIWGLIRRFVLRPQRQTANLDWLYFMATIFVLLTTYLIMEALRIADRDTASVLQHPIAEPLAHVLRGMDLTGGKTHMWYSTLWWLNFAVVCAFLIHSRYSAHVHGIAAPLNIVFRPLGPQGEITSIDAETARASAVTTIGCLTRKELLDTFACAECGRCQISCPAHLSGKVLNPKDVLLKVKEHLLNEGPGLLGRRMGEGKVIFDESVSEEAVWDCTTCGACQQQCPVLNEHVNLIVDLRRQLVEQGRIAPTMRNTLENTRSLGNPWGESQTTRSTLAEQFQMPLAETGGKIELLYWVGCASIYDERARDTTRAMASVLNTAGIKYAVLGAQEVCCGDPARRLGEEGLFQTLVRSNVEAFGEYNVKRILTQCPHCYNTFKNEYNRFGCDIEVIHHSQFIWDLIQSAKISPGSVRRQRITFHDPCYLGRYNGQYAAPRQVLSAIGGAEIVEMKSCQENSFCCGAGGGHLWLPDSSGQRIENLRFEQAQAINPQVIATACPYCTIMFDAAAKANGTGVVKVLDIAELLMETAI